LDIKLLDGLRDMNKRDIQNALGDRLPKKVEMPDVDLSKVDPEGSRRSAEARREVVDSIDLEDRSGEGDRRPAEPAGRTAALIALVAVLRRWLPPSG
jgi:hypothetical protein